VKRTNIVTLKKLSVSTSVVNKVKLVYRHVLEFNKHENSLVFVSVKINKFTLKGAFNFIESFDL
jgi:hypothetical protein